MSRTYPASQTSPTPDAGVRVGVIIVAGGAGQRLGLGIPKAQVQVAGRSILDHALQGVLDAGVAHEICVVVPAADTALRAAVAEVVTDIPVLLVAGGATRPDSVNAGLAALSPGISHVLVHDAARALTPPDVFQRVVAALRAGAEAVIPVIPVVDTIKTVDGGLVTGTPPRDTLRAVQTPQGFNVDTLRLAHQTPGAAVTDDAMLLERLGIPVQVVDGDDAAFKVTTAQDLRLAAILAPTPTGKTQP
ncbi:MULTISPECIES: 2-C-methyl-D-erythritol 4-phosphate cytidylyltransferase [unclassified Arthrobacter]|uniref:2-C-methyl-D-erythritol 4-phosphate cytidylyltransferase n=1 Tax=unclassified Arthrobacter TaxID=235627 RepID=UPI00298F23C9|nr:2-C-methyl-D-erythritol 4-phosphate cytidylyltransferase [Arthrobacter sp. AET 35A]